MELSDGYQLSGLAGGTYSGSLGSNKPRQRAVDTVGPGAGWKETVPVSLQAAQDGPRRTRGGQLRAASTWGLDLTPHLQSQGSPT